MQKLCEDENLDEIQFKNLMKSYIFSGKEPLREEVFGCLESRPSLLQAKNTGERIISKMKEFVEVFEMIT